MKVYKISNGLFQVEIRKNKAVVVTANNEKDAIKKARLKSF